jgi:hypothetical protein
VKPQILLFSLAMWAACGENPGAAGVGATPGAPGPLLVTAASNGALALAWRDNSTNETAFEIETAVDTSAYVPLATLPPDQTTYSHTNPRPNRYYKYRVRACAAAVCSPWSNENGRKSEYPPMAPAFQRLSTFDMQARSTNLQVWHQPGAPNTEVYFEYALATESLDGPNAVRSQVQLRSPEFDPEGEPRFIFNSVQVFGLVPNTQYHFRARLSNPWGTVVTQPLVFTTRADPAGS